MRLDTAIWIGAFSSMIMSCGGGGGGGGIKGSLGGRGGNGGSGSGVAGSGGGGTGGGGLCNAEAPCGGAIEGTWEVTSTCLNGDLAASMTASMTSAGQLPTACNSLFQSFTMDMTGTVTFANGTVSSDTTRTVKGKAHFTPPCYSALTGATTASISASMCSTMESSLKSSSTFNSVTCSVSAGNCDCNLVQTSSSPSEDSYSVSGTQLIDPTGNSDPMGFCVAGTTLTLHQTSSDAPNITLIITLRRN